LAADFGAGRFSTQTPVTNASEMTQCTFGDFHNCDGDVGASSQLACSRYQRTSRVMCVITTTLVKLKTGLMDRYVLRKQECDNVHESPVWQIICKVV